MSLESKIKSFDPNSAASNDGNIFGLPFTVDEARLVLLPVPWDVTVSYSDGTSEGPEAIFDASAQVDLHDPIVKDSWKIGVAMAPVSKKIRAKNTFLREKAVIYINNLVKGVDEEAKPMKRIRGIINEGCTELKSWVYGETKKLLEQGKLVGLVGGDHSTPLGFMEALSEIHPGFAILQLDAHADLRKAYEGFEYSHASIMFNALKNERISKLVQVGIRDWCEEEDQYIRNSRGRVKTFFDHELKRRMYEGESWMLLCKEIIAALPDKVYISFDIDGLDPKLCPNTGTPVAGGMEFHQAAYLLEQLARSGKKIIGFDLNEVAPGPKGDDWNGNVGARMLFKMCNLTSANNGLAKWA